ncbi:sigma-70 family RNA polymerase sigma factor [Planctomycetota bacterium]
MRKIENENLAQLLLQLRFAPQKERKKQLDAAEKLLGIIDKDTEYPFEFVCFRITGYHPKNKASAELIKGDILAENLRVFITKLCENIGCYAPRQSQKVYTIEQLANEFSVSTKTIHRWRKCGLVARKFIFDDEKKRLGFLQSSLDKFLQHNPELVSKAKRFKRLTKQEKQFVIKRVRQLGGKHKMSRHQVIDKIAKQIARSHETVRYTILSYENKYPEKKLFKKPAGVINPTQAREIYKLYQQGVSAPELMRRFDRSKSSIYRIINMRIAKAILTKKIGFVSSNEFLTKNAKDSILAKPLSAESSAPVKGGIKLNLTNGSLPGYLETLKQAPLLTREQEFDLFRRYNYLKYLGCLEKAGIKPQSVSSRELKRIENYLEQAEIIKNMLIEANLRLVVSIANRHTVSGTNLLDLISEGNVSLMNAVEKFDYTRGFRFITYASWAITKDFARQIPAEAAWQDKAPAASLKNVQRDLRTAVASGAEAVERARRDLVQAIRNNLSVREQFVIINHFGLLGTLVKKEKKTLKQIGDDLGVTKERARQIELKALQKLRHYLSREEFELLTG